MGEGIRLIVKLPACRRKARMSRLEAKRDLDNPGLSAQNSGFAMGGRWLGLVPFSQTSVLAWRPVPCQNGWGGEPIDEGELDCPGDKIRWGART